MWAASFTRDGLQLLTLSYTPLLVSSSFSAMVVGARRTATHRHHCMRAQAHARLKGLVDHAEVNIGTAKAAVLGMERLRDTALLRALQVTTREVAINKATPSVHIGAQLATEHTKEFLVPVIVAVEPWQHNVLVGDAILGINGTPTLSWSHNKVVSTLKAASGMVKLTVCVAMELFAAVADAQGYNSL